MTARYKLTKFRDKWNDGFYKPKHPDPNTVERQKSYREVRRELVDQHINHQFIIRDEARMDREEAEAWACYEMELADPNYECKCFED